ncbi:hypothetical protein BAU15_02855 [Enterococcus sp. JM4C]|uniref:helix-turn-helix domain-containing protein n=1 Tax=Candidatus Enterococcus huntleyi TaxID=1857217 RepID=UPI001379BA6C|nr:XRE family transcriptional regulator [Enterococcus sp. JM4C]KAF1299600.1 hypothetical protein BAU15_02855 [Enterococcus sp. JM4C]
MSIIKTELGKKIRLYREAAGLTREEFCQDQAELTVRQLQRIEAGVSVPTLPKLEFIAKILKISISDLLDEQAIQLPNGYLKLKRALLKFYTYGDTNKREQKERIFDEIYEKYYEILPEEEQLSVDVQRSSMDVKHTDNAAFGEEILSDYFYQITIKKQYTENDLHILYLYFNCQFYELDDRNTFDELVSTLIESVDYKSTDELFLLSRILITVISIFEITHNYASFARIIKVLRVIMDATKDYNRKPVVDMLEGKYLLFHEQKIIEAEKQYMKASELAALLGEEFLSSKIKAEFQKDLGEYQLTGKGSSVEE